MNGPSPLYQMRKIVEHDVPVDLPTCMYKMKNIYSERNGVVNQSTGHISASTKKLDVFDQVKQFLKNNHTIPGMAELELRQEKILQQLAELKKQMLSIKAELQISTSKTKSPVHSGYNISVTELPELVINANPNNPPYSLAVIQRLWRDFVDLSITSHLHSSVSSLQEDVVQFVASLENFKVETVPKLHVRIIWKKIDTQMELIVSNNLPIVGEVNILRYLSRVFANQLSYDAQPDSIEIDALLDICHLLSRARTKTEKTSLLQSLNKSLGKSEWLAGRNQISVADIAAFSVIKQCSQYNDVNVNLGKWVQRCQAVL